MGRPKCVPDKPQFLLDARPVLFEVRNTRTIGPYHLVGFTYQ